MRNNHVYYTGDEYHIRLGIYSANARWCQDFNRRNNKPFTVSLNKLSALTPAEYSALQGARIPRRLFEKDSSSLTQNDYRRIKSQKWISYSNAPESFDWREKGVLNPIQDQGACGSCWAFSGICSCESAYAIRHPGELFKYSEQNMVDCVEAASGCGGGWPHLVIAHSKSNQNSKFALLEDYPYIAIQNWCTFDQTKAVGHIDGWIDGEYGDEKVLLENILNVGVASVCIDSQQADFQMYSGGIYSSDSCSSLSFSHAVNAVGFGVEGGVEYWVVRNSWGSDWGEEGYFRLARNAGNMCAIATNTLVAYVD
ncbi:Crustapain [Tritrichomonas foetus]|uniref:Crustapain n=1 Tax=Tritrichomonas foetus TaxID=1144522 RepID=A0A1J4L2J4_9EUKA|nr:Crustapain [Tritrichomonas foetus]|eukprot:OHT16188.1 Crustapain [Tritrichomonas foetus]